MSEIQKVVLSTFVKLFESHGESIVSIKLKTFQERQNARLWVFISCSTCSSFWMLSRGFFGSSNFSSFGWNLCKKWIAYFIQFVGLFYETCFCWHFLIPPIVTFLDEISVKNECVHFIHHKIFIWMKFVLKIKCILNPNCNSFA